MTEKEKEQPHFGYETIESEEKEGRVGAVFDSVAGKYDLMNDVMSAGIHRAWKNWYVWQTGVKPGEAVLDLAAGTGDITLRLAKRMRGKGAGADIEGRLVSSDINVAMLKIGEERLRNKGWLKNLEFIIANAEALPFEDNSFDLITMAFGLRNVTHQDKALAEMARAEARRARAGTRILAPEKRRHQPLLRLVQLHLPAENGRVHRQRRRQLPIPRRIHPHAPAARRTESHVRRRRAYRLRIPEPQQRHRRHPQRSQTPCLKPF